MVRSRQLMSGRCSGGSSDPFFSPRPLPVTCHPDRSEGSAFLPSLSASSSAFCATSVLRKTRSLAPTALLPAFSLISTPVFGSSNVDSPSLNPSPATLTRIHHSCRKTSRVTPLFATLTSHLQSTENKATLSPFPATLTYCVKHNPFVCHSYRKHPGWGYILQIESLPKGLRTLERSRRPL
jgi:hypothetical protein